MIAYVVMSLFYDVSVSISKYESQLLLNTVIRLYIWYLKEKSSKSLQRKPELYFNGSTIKRIERGENFRFVAR